MGRTNPDNFLGFAKKSLLLISIKAVVLTNGQIHVLVCLRERQRFVWVDLPDLMDRLHPPATRPFSRLFRGFHLASMPKEMAR